MSRLEEIETLIARIATGDRRAFRDLYRHVSPKLFGICLRVLNDRAEAEDALQEIFVKIWNGADRYRANGLSPMTWLITVARNHAIDRLRRRRIAQGDMDEAIELADPAPGPEAQVVAAGETARLTACLEELGGERADAVRGAYLTGLTYKELAAHHGVPLNTMRTWLRRSLMKLKECLTR